jgi:hypothetical protein
MDKELVNLMYDVLVLTNEVTEMIKQGNIEYGYTKYLESISYDVEGVCVESERFNKYNLYTFEQYDLLYKLATKFNDLENRLEDIKNGYIRSIIKNIMKDIIDKVDLCLLDNNLLPIFSFITDNRIYEYTIARYDSNFEWI